MITVKNLFKKYASKTILNNVSVEITDGSVSFLMGRNGSGKSTFIKCLLDLEDYEGTISFADQPYDHCKENVYAIFDDSALYKELSGYHNIQLLTGKKRAEFNHIAKNYLNEDILKKKAKFYSFGEKKKVLLIVIEILRPKVIIMDEVSSGLDYETMVYLKDQIRKWSEDSCILLTGHQFDFYQSIIDSLLIITDDGHIKQEKYHDSKPLEEIYEQIAM